MQAHRFLQRCAHAAFACITLFAMSAAAKADDLPPYMAPIAGRTAASASEVATGNVLALNTMMFELYGNAAAIFQKNILSKHPIILGLFSGAGGRFILYRPGMAPLEAPQVPIAYQLLKSAGHSTMAISEVVGPYLDNPADQSWRGAMLAYRSRMQSALDGLDATPMPPEWRDNTRAVLANNAAFMDDCLAKGVITFAALEKFGKQQAPYLARNIAWAAQTQVGHWMSVIADWKNMLGAAWDKDLCGQQHHLCRAPEQHPVQCARTVLRPRGHQRPPAPDRDDLVHDNAGRHDGVADPHHRRSLGGSAVLRQLSPDGL